MICVVLIKLTFFLQLKSNPFFEHFLIDPVVGGWGQLETGGGLMGSSCSHSRVILLLIYGDYYVGLCGCSYDVGLLFYSEINISIAFSLYIYNVHLNNVMCLC